MRTLKYLLIAFITLSGAVIAIFGAGLWNLRSRALQAETNARETARNAEQALRDMEPYRAELYLSTIRDEVRSLGAALSLWQNFVPFLSNAAERLSRADGLAGASVEIMSDLDFLKRNGAQLMLRKQGDEFIRTLERLNANIKALSRSADRKEAYEASLFLDAAIAWITEPANTVAVMFQNPSEIRPGGGFLGSFAHLALDRGSIGAIEAQDIYDIDGQLMKKIIPPEPLQGITTKWGARDANWFPDFPRSARKTIELLEASKTYAEPGIRFSAAIAVNTRVLEDILAIVGSVEIPAADGAPPVTITAETFLEEIQRTVETAQNKNVLKDAMPAIFGKINDLDDAAKGRLASMIGERIANKDIMVWFENPIMQAFVEHAGIGGELYPTPLGLEGSYASVSYANVAGGKMDAVTSQSVTIAETLRRDGVIETQVELERKNEGGGKKDHWYNTTNRTYLRFLAPPDAKLMGTEGGYARKIVPAANYEKAGYAEDPDLAADLGKAIFPIWLDVPVGEARRVSVRYERALTHAFEGDAIPYRFAFDKQSGIDGPLAITITAPSGYAWKDSGTETYEYRAGTQPSRVTLNLTLIRK